MDLIDRQAAIDAIIAEGRTVDSRYLESERIVHESDAVEALAMLPSAEPEVIKINIDHELTKDEYEKLRKDMADAPIVLQPERKTGHIVVNHDSEKIFCSVCGSELEGCKGAEEKA